MSIVPRAIMHILLYTRDNRIWMIAYMIYLFSCWSYSLPALSLSQEGAAYFEAKEYEKAIELYEKVAKSDISSWQQAAVQYNIGTCYMAAGDVKSALRVLRGIQTISPLVLRQIHQNLALILMKDDKTLQEAKLEIDAAIRADCILLKVEGSQDCHPSPTLYEIRDFIEKKLSAIPSQPFQNIVESNDPQSILDASIKEQEHALLINRLYQESNVQSVETRQLVNEAQAKVLMVAEPYLKHVLEYEKQNYPKQCQCTPWDNIIPNFEKGYQLAKWKLAYIPIQEEILRLWRDAKEPPKKPPEKPSNEVLRELQKMEQEDNLPQVPKPLNTKGIKKPW